MLPRSVRRLKSRLKQNGLLLEAVSLTRLDQTPFHALDQNNAFQRSRYATTGRSHCRQQARTRRDREQR